MSALDVIATLRDCLQDDTVGLAAAVAGLAPNASDPTRIRLDFNFVKWKLAGASVQQTTLTPNVMLRPRSWRPELKRANLRSSVVLIDVGMEWFDSETDVLQDNIVIGATALARVLDGLRDYSDAHGGTVIDVIDPINYVFGEFEFDGPVSSGFLATIQIEEQSAHE